MVDVDEFQCFMDFHNLKPFHLLVRQFRVVDLFCYCGISVINRFLQDLLKQSKVFLIAFPAGRLIIPIYIFYGINNFRFSLELELQSSNLSLNVLPT
jgi:hypothetical protein